MSFGTNTFGDEIFGTGTGAYTSRVNSELELDWQVKERVRRTISISYFILNDLNKLLPITYSVTNQVRNTLNIQYSVFTKSKKYLTINWSVKGIGTPITVNNNNICPTRSVTNINVCK